MRHDCGVVSSAELAKRRRLRILVDTTLVVEGLVADQAENGDANRILTAIAESDADIVFSRLLEIETPQAVAYIAGQRIRGNRRAGLRDGRVRRRSRRMAHDIRRAWEDLLEGNRWQRIELQDVADDIHDVMFSTGLSSYDAVHAASAIAAGCDAIATLDTDFGRLPRSQVATIITTPQRLARTRRLRAGV